MVMSKLCGYVRNSNLISWKQWITTPGASKLLGDFQRKGPNIYSFPPSRKKIDNDTHDTRFLWAHSKTFFLWEHRERVENGGIVDILQGAQHSKLRICVENKD